MRATNGYSALACCAAIMGLAAPAFSMDMNNAGARPGGLIRVADSPCTASCTMASGATLSCSDKWCKVWDRENGISCWDEKTKKACNCSGTNQTIHGVFVRPGECEDRDHEYVPR